MQKIPKGKHEDKISIVDYEEMIFMENMMINGYVRRKDFKS